MLCVMTWGVFIFFAGFVILMTLFIIFCVPETKGVPDEEMDELIIRKHWLWSRVVAGAHRSQGSSSSGVDGSPASLAKDDSASFAVGRVKSSTADDDLAAKTPV